MDEKKLTRLTKGALLQLLRKRGVKANRDLLKKDLVALLVKANKDAGEDSPEKPAIDGGSRQKTRTLKREPISDHNAETVRREQEYVEETKYSTEIGASGPGQEKAPREVRLPEEPSGILPTGYGEDRIVAMVRDPYWIFAYWEVTPETFTRARNEMGDEHSLSKATLRVYDITGVDFTGENANTHFDIEVACGADNWYINTGWPNRVYCVDIGLAGPGNVFYTLARSNAVGTPRAGMSEEIDERWMNLEEEFQRMYALSGGFEVGSGSVGLREMMEKQLEQQLASEAAGSLFSMAARPKERAFWLQVNTELIVYGATQPDASVTIQGRPVRLRPDGTFSVRFALPDGTQVIPVTAQSADGIEERTITPTVSRTTTVPEPVLHG